VFFAAVVAVVFFAAAFFAVVWLSDEVDAADFAGAAFLAGVDFFAAVFLAAAAGVAFLAGVRRSAVVAELLAGVAAAGVDGVACACGSSSTVATLLTTGSDADGMRLTSGSSAAAGTDGTALGGTGVGAGRGVAGATSSRR